MSSNKPFPSSDLDVFKENSLILDNFVNSQENEHPDRFGRKRPTITGIIKEAFNVRTDISNMNETLIGQSRWDTVPKNTSLSLGGDNGALNKQAQALFNRTEMLKVHAREALRRTYQEVGLVLVPGSFEDGGNLETIADILLEEKTGKVYSWSGSFPKVVNKGTLPSSEVEFVEKSNKTLRNDILRELQELKQQLVNLTNNVNNNTEELESKREICLVNALGTGHGNEVVEPAIGPVINNDQRVVLPNPFGINVPVIPIVEIFINNKWGDPRFGYNDNGLGVHANYIQGEGIVVQSGSYSLTANSHHNGDGFGIIGGAVTAAPYRVRVLKG